MDYQVKITPTAETDLEDIYTFIASDNPAAAAKFFKTLRDKANSLKWSPKRCSKIPERIDSPYDYRHLIVKKYRIIFCVVGDTVWITRIIHGARQLDIETLLYYFE